VGTAGRLGVAIARAAGIGGRGPAWLNSGGKVAWTQQFLDVDESDPTCTVMSYM